MRSPGLVLSVVLLGAPAWAQEDLRSFTPSSRSAEAVSTYVNAEVLRVARDGAVTFRSESGEIVLRVSDEALREVSNLRRGDKVILTYRTRQRADGSSVRVVSDVRAASATSGEPAVAAGNASTTVIAPEGGAVRPVRVVSVDRAGRTLTVVDQTGVAFVAPVTSSAAITLRSVRSGDALGLSFDPSLGGSVFGTVTAIQPFAFPVFGAGVEFPAVSGQLVNVNRQASTVTVRTSGGEVTVPVSGVALGSFGTLRTGDNISLDLGSIGSASRAGVAGGTAATAAGGVQPAMNVTGRTPGGSGPFGVTRVSPFTGVSGVSGFAGTSADVRPGLSPIAPNLSPVNAIGLSGVTNAAAGVGSPGGSPLTPGSNLATGAQAGTIGTTGSGVSGAGTVSFPGAVPGAGPIAGGPLMPALPQPPVPGGAVPGSAGPTSPFHNNVPSVPGATPIVSAVLPPALAKAPLTNDQVGLMRAQGEADLDGAAVVLAAAANDIDAAWFRFKQVCLGGFIVNVTPGREWFILWEGGVGTPTDDACRQMFNELNGRAAGFRQQLGIVTDAARQADVLPGRVREVLERHRLNF